MPYTRQWNLKISKGTETDYSVHLEVNTGTTPQVTVSVSGPYDSVVVRCLGYIVVSLIPEKGLAEAVRCLRDIWQFHTEEEPLSSLPSLPHKISPRVERKEKRADLVLSK